MGEFWKFEVPIPPIDLQLEFDHFIEQVDKSKVISESSTKSRFIEMFGHINLNEKDLPKKALSEVCLLITDGSHYSPADEPDGKYPMLSVKDLSNGKFDYSGCKHINQGEYDKLVKEGCKPIKNDVLIAKDGSVFQKSMIVIDEIDQVILSSIAIIRPKTDVINPIYLERYLMSDYVKEDVINNYTTGTAIRRIILKNLAKLKLIVPDIEVQNEFASFVEQVDKSKYIANKAKRWN
jgi:type I restriction enzyme S subunit